MLMLTSLLYTFTCYPAKTIRFNPVEIGTWFGTISQGWLLMDENLGHERHSRDASNSATRKADTPSACWCYLTLYQKVHFYVCDIHSFVLSFMFREVRRLPWRGSPSFTTLMHEAEWSPSGGSWPQQE